MGSAATGKNAAVRALGCHRGPARAVRAAPADWTAGGGVQLPGSRRAAVCEGLLLVHDALLVLKAVAPARVGLRQDAVSGKKSSRRGVAMCRHDLVSSCRVLHMIWSEIGVSACTQ